MSGPDLPEERFVEVRGLRLPLRCWPGRGQPALLLHGWLDHCGSFDLLAPLLAAAGPAFPLDLRGHGDSGWGGAGGFFHMPPDGAALPAADAPPRPRRPVRAAG